MFDNVLLSEQEQIFKRSAMEVEETMSMHEKCLIREH